jgi:hypothetical protein
MEAEFALERERESREKKRSFAEWLGLHEDRVGPIPGGVAAWLGAALFWVLLMWAIFG